MLWLRGLASGYFARTDITKFYIAFAVETINTECKILGLKKCLVVRFNCNVDVFNCMNKKLSNIWCRMIQSLIPCNLYRDFSADGQPLLEKIFNSDGDGVVSDHW